MNGRFHIMLVVLFSVMPLDAFAQAVITVSPESIGGFSLPISPEPPSFGTAYFSALAGAEGSFRGFTGDSDLALNLGIGYASQGTGEMGAAYHANAMSPNTARMNYIEVDASIRHLWWQAGFETSFPLNWEITTYSSFGPAVWNVSRSDMRTSLGIFAAGNFMVSEWCSGKLIFVARLDLDGLSSPLTSNVVLLMTGDPAYGFFYAPNIEPFFLARIGLSYEFTVWSGAR